ncbi:hypothetical protein ACFL2S_15515 [Thermodesulfobacteriota bacterium]
MMRKIVKKLNECPMRNTLSEIHEMLFEIKGKAPKNSHCPIIPLKTFKGIQSCDWYLISEESAILGSDSIHFVTLKLDKYDNRNFKTFIKNQEYQSNTL